MKTRWFVTGFAVSFSLIGIGVWAAGKALVRELARATYRRTP